MHTCKSITVNNPQECLWPSVGLCTLGTCQPPRFGLDHPHIQDQGSNRHPKLGYMHLLHASSTHSYICFVYIFIPTSRYRYVIVQVSGLPRHTRSVALRASQRLGFLRKAAPILDDHGRVTVYKGFVRPLLEYAPLAWSSAAATNMAQLDKVQQRALHFLGPGTILQSLQLCRMVAALSYLFKLHYIPGPPQVKAMLPPTKPPAVASMCTRQKRQTHHAFQLKWTPPRTAPDYLLRSFPFFAITPWNNLPADLLLHEPHSRRLQTFKVNVCKDLIRKRWLWSTQYL